MLGVQVEALEGRAAAGGTPFVTVSGGREERLAQAVEAIEPLLGRPLRVKWPNDVYADDRKLAGVLIDAGLSGADTFLIGVGVNVNRTRFPRELEAIATSLALLGGREHDRHGLLYALARRIDAMASLLQGGGDDTLARAAARYADRLGLLGAEIELDAGERCHGVLQSFDFAKLTLTDGRTFPLGQVRALRRRRGCR